MNLSLLLRNLRNCFLFEPLEFAPPQVPYRRRILDARPVVFSSPDLQDIISRAQAEGYQPATIQQIIGDGHNGCLLFTRQGSTEDAAYVLSERKLEGNVLYHFYIVPEEPKSL